MYKGILRNTGINVPDDEALKYALDGIVKNENIQKEFLEWFFSGDFVKEVER